MSKPLLIKFPVFNDWDIHVEVSQNFEKAITRYKFTLEGYTEENTNALTVHMEEEARCYVFFRPRASPGTITHEAWHAMTHIFETLGIELDHESMAYHLGYVVDQIYRYVKRRK